MSCRCHTVIQDEKGKFHSVRIYRHSDGHPDGKWGVLTALLPLCKDFMLRRGWQPEYLAAQITWLYKNLLWEYYISQEQEKKAAFEAGNLDHGQYQSYIASYAQFRYLGVGVESFDRLMFNGDEEYIYVVKPDHVEVREPTRAFSDKPHIKNTKRTRCVDFDGQPCRPWTRKPKPAPTITQEIQKVLKASRANRSINV